MFIIKYKTYYLLNIFIIIFYLIYTNYIYYVVSVYVRNNDNISFWKGLTNRREEKGGFSYLLQNSNLRVNVKETTESLKTNKQTKKPKYLFTSIHPPGI